MSMDFSVVGEKRHCNEWCAECDKQFINMSNVNACDVLRALGIDTSECYGEMPARKLAKLCRANLNIVDPGQEGYEEGRVINCARRPGYLNERIAQILALCERAGDLGKIAWG